MLSFKRNGNVVKVRIDYNTPDAGEWYNQTDWPVGNEPQASILRAHLQEQLENKLETIRREAYEQGYRDGRAKTSKKTWFSCHW